MAKNTLIVIAGDQEEYEEKLRTLDLPDLDILLPKNPLEIKEALKKANIMLARPPLAKDYINEAEKVVWMQSTYAGIDAMNAEGLRKNYILTNVRDVYGPALAEYVFAYILAFKKEVFENIAYQKDKQWTQRSYDVLENQTLCVLGSGSIGKQIARIGKCFGMRTLGYRSHLEPVEFFDRIYTDTDLGDFLAQGDYIVNVLPNTKYTDDIINKETIAHMKRTAVFINVGRGNAVEEADLIKAVEEGRIGKVVLDVFKVEPLPLHSPLWSIPNVYITPHMSGYVRSDKIFEIFEENYGRFRAGQELNYRVDFAKGY